jgi:CheY-like chemotaxis protein
MTTILCIDDDPNVLEVHKAVLETKGYTVLTAANGLAGIAIIRKHSIDLVITDFHMSPGMDGSQVAQLLMIEKPMLPVVIYSGCPAEIPKRLKCLVLCKGDVHNNLVSTIDELVGLNCTAKKQPARKKSKSSWQKKAS